MSDQEDPAGMSAPPTPAAEPSLAAARFRAGPPATSRSFRLHRMRGPFCAAGTCQRCPVRTSDGVGLACEIPSSEGTVVRIDVRRAIARTAESLSPWFYEGRFLRPRALRRSYIEVVRRLSAAPPLPSTTPHAPRTALDDLHTDALVVGAGPSGLSAATELAARGLDMVLVEREGRVGGSARQRGWAVRPLADGVRTLTSSTCVGIYPTEAIAGVVTADGPLGVRFDRLVIATGAYDRPLTYAGNDLPGTIGVRAFERLALQGAFASRTRLGLVAAPAEAERAAAAASRHGLRFDWAAGPVDLDRSVAKDVVVDRVVSAHGRRRLRAVELERSGTMPTDFLVLGFTQPTYQLAVHAGATAAVAGSPPVVITDAPSGALVVGEAAGAISDPAISVAEIVGRWLDAGDVAPPAEPPALPEASVPSPDAFVCFCEDVRVRDIETAVADGFADAELVKRRTGAGTGACQGTYCLGEVVATLERVGVPGVVPTVRPPVHPIQLADLAVLDV